MKIKGIFLTLFATCFLFIAGTTSTYAQFGQFGKNNVRYRQLDQFYESYWFDVWHNLDLNDPAQKEYLEMVVANLENARDWMGSEQIYNHTIEKRIPVFLYKTHTDMESSNLVGGFLPEGVGAFAESERRRMVLKAYFSKPLSRAIGVHELAHEFQFDIRSFGFIERMISINSQRPQWFYEGGAEFIAGLYEPHTRDDIRGIGQKTISSDRHFIPTWEALGHGRVSPYLMTMVFDFLEEKFNAGVAFQVQGFKQSNVGLGELLYDLTKGELGNPDVDSEKFNQAITRFWMDKYGDEFNARPKPDEKNDNFEGRLIMPWGHSAPMSSPVLSPGGTQLAAFTFLKYGVSLVRYEISEDKTYVPKEKRKKLENENYAFSPNGYGLVNLTPQLPPIPWENVVSQLQTWPFNGFDASWSPDGKRIAFFARINRDHALVIINAESGKILQKIELESPRLDQAFSPSFTPDGKKIVFSAAQNTTRDIYVIDLESEEIENLTNDERFNTAPSVSPDGSMIVYVGSDGDFQHLFLYEFATGASRQITFGELNDGWPSWSDDGSTIVYASDEADGIWNLHTLDLTSKTVRQWTEFLLGVKTPVFVRGSTDTVYYVSPAEDTQRGGVYDKIFEAKLKKPIRQYMTQNTGKAGKFVFNSSRDLFKFELDENQLLNPKEPPEQWKCRGSNINIGVYTYFGVFGQSYLRCSNILETKQRLAQLVLYGDFRIIDYVNVNQTNRATWVWGVNHSQIPLYYQFYDIAKGSPRQPILNQTWAKEYSFSLAMLYPLNKFNRFELYSRLRHRSYSTGISREEAEAFPESFSPNDLQLIRFFENSSSSNIAFGGAYVRDTIIYSYNTWGPFHGNAFRAQVEFAPPIGAGFQGYTSANVSARTYRHLGSSSLFAGRVDIMTDTRANGDFILLCGPERLRGCEYGSIIGNQVGYASAELRFPVPGTYVLGIPIRAFLFADAAYARFNNEEFPAQRRATYGFGAQSFLPFVGLPAQLVWTLDKGKLKPSFYITLHW